MAHSNRPRLDQSFRNIRARGKRKHNARLQLRYELLEPRHLLAFDLPVGVPDSAGHATSSPSQSPEGSTPTPAPITWFETFADVNRIPLTSLHEVDRPLPTDVAGPAEPAIGEWIIQLSSDAARSTRRLSDVANLLSNDTNQFSIISGLGSEGLLLARGTGASRADIEAGLRTNTNVATFSLNQLIQGQATTPNESDFSAQLLPGLNKINATSAWDESIGSMSTVVGVVDSGIDPKHPDLYLNIWVNQGEIPSELLDDTGNKLVDIDNDGLITFYDLNHATRDATAPYALTVAGFANGPNAEFVRDLNTNGRIDADDLLKDARWTSGTDDDGNGFFDDLFGVNFRAGVGDPFASNNPTDELGHGTHVAGTIGAIGSNSTGVVGVNWQTSLMSLRILDNNNQGDSGAAIRAINYTRDLRERLTINNANRVTEGASVKVLNNSWGQPGGYEASLESAIEQLYDANILFVAAAGNGNILGNGVDNDRTPFYPASYDVSNVIAVAAADANDRLATFSNFGRTSVDILAPGVGIRSTVPGGGYQSANGTSMAAPHVAGTAALIWSALPESTVDEVKQAILSTTTPASQPNIVATNGRLNANAAINADVFAPAARLVAKQDITTAGGSTTEFTVEYRHRSGIDLSTLGDDDLLVERSWGEKTQLPAKLKTSTPSSNGEAVLATYEIDAPGGGRFESQKTNFQNGVTSNFVQYRSSTPVTIPQTIATITSQINVATSGSFIGNIGDISVTLDITHSFVSDLKVTLIAPNNARAILFSNIGGSTDNFTSTTFDDTASRPISAGSAPFTGVFRPTQSLSSLGITNPDGIWTLEVVDSETDDGGSLNSWSLSIKESFNEPSKLQSQIFVPSLSNISSQFTLTIESPVSSFNNVNATLIGPRGQRASLFSNKTFDSTASQTVRLSDSATESVSNAVNPLDGEYRPEQPLSELGRDGGGGVWSLELLGGITLAEVENFRWSLEFKAEWDILDYGNYNVTTIPGSVKSTDNSFTKESREAGNFRVRIEDPSVQYVDNFTDSNDSNSLRSAILRANSLAPTPQTIILEAGSYSIEISPVEDANSAFASDLISLGIVNSGGWSNGTTGDFDIDGNIRIIGSTSDDTVIDARQVDRLFKIRQDASLKLSRLALQNGVASSTLGGGAILTLGQLELDETILRKNNALQKDIENPLPGGAISAWAGSVDIDQTWLTQNQADRAGALYLGGSAVAEIQRSTLEQNKGGAIHSDSDENSIIANSTFSSNSGGFAVISKNVFGSGNADSNTPSISFDGRFIAFESSASNLVSNDLNGVSDIFLYDRQDSSVKMVSVSSTGTQANVKSYEPSTSGDGRFVAFTSDALGLVPDDTNFFADIFVHDRLNSTTRRVSLSSAGTQGTGASGLPDISADGNFVSFASTSAELVPGDTNSEQDIFVVDLRTNEIQRVPALPGQEANGLSLSSSINRDGGFVAFASEASNLVVGDTNGRADVFVFNRSTNTVERVSVNNSGQGGNAFSDEPSISADGQLVAFSSLASNLVAGDSNNAIDIFVYNRTTRSIERVSMGISGVQSNGDSSWPSISGDGRYVTFESGASNLVAGDTNGRSDIFVFDLVERTTARLSLSASQTQGNGDSQRAQISEDGSFYAFQSRADQLVSGANQQTWDILAGERTGQSLISISYGPSVSIIDVSHSTFVATSTTQFDASVFGDVHVSDSFFSTSAVTRDIDTRLPYDETTNILSNASQAELISPLVRIGSNPPVHRLVQGNPAIDTARSKSIGTIDQLGQVRMRPDVGAVETVFATAEGKVYVDINRNGFYEIGEPGLGSIHVSTSGAANLDFITAIDEPSTIFNDESGDFVLDQIQPGESFFSFDLPAGFSFYSPPLEMVRSGTIASNGDATRGAASGDGMIIVFQSAASNLVPGDNNGVDDIFIFDRSNRSIQRISLSNTGIEANGASTEPAISNDGRYIVFQSAATNLVSGDSNGFEDVFIFDRLAQRIDRVSVTATGAQASGSSSATGSTRPTISADGRYVTFQSDATNLVASDRNGQGDIFVVDRVTKVVERVSVSSSGVEANLFSEFPHISADGRYVTFASVASNLVPGDSFLSVDVFLYDRDTNNIQRVSQTSSGVGGNGLSYFPTVSASGRFVSYFSEANNLVADDRNAVADIFIFDRETNVTERVSVNNLGEEGNGASNVSSMSADGRFVVFQSSASNLVPNDRNRADDVFVFDRQERTIARVSVSDAGIEGNGPSVGRISADGRTIIMLSGASNLVPGDQNTKIDGFFVANPLAPSGILRNFSPGERLKGLNFGVVADSGSLEGRIFQDTVPNGVFDLGEPSLGGSVVFLDLDNDGILDDTEPFSRTDSTGSYRFSNLDTYRKYSVVLANTTGFEIVSPDVSRNRRWEVFLPAGGVITDLDFAVIEVNNVGQSSASSISGRLFDDRNNNGVYDSSTDFALSGIEIFLDASNFGIRDTSEPRTVTDAEGRYLFNGLSARNVAVSAVLDETLVNVNPLGSKFTLEKQPLFAGVTPFGNPQAIASGDFNNDGFLDVAVALGEANKLSIRLNDGKGGFLPEEIDVDLGTSGAGPTSLVVGQFDNDTKLDVALTANFTGNVTILRNFDPATKAFEPAAYVKVGDEPLDIAAGQLGGDAKPDLVVVNKAGNTVQLLTNNGSGVFTAGSAVATGGKNASSILVGNFTGNASLDVAVIHASPLTNANPFGGVTLLRGDGASGLTLVTGYYTVGATPTDAVLGDFNKDGRPDIAVSNFATNSISILLGQADGTLRVQTAILGTASGAFDLAVGDIDNDGDLDVIASNLRDRNISIFRNIGEVGGEVQFEPLENIGLGQFSLAQRMPLVVANFDNDTSGTGGEGTIDIVTIPQKTDTLHLLKNTLVNGAHRVALTGLATDVRSNLDFIVKPAILPPSFDVVANPLPIFEDAAQQSIAVSGIKKGRTAGPQLQFTATSSNTALIASPTVVYSGGATATVQYTPIANISGTTIITVRGVDAGADAEFGGADDGFFERSFTVSVLAVNDPPVFNILAEASAKQTDGVTTVANFVTGLGNGGGADETPQTRDPLVVTATDTSFFSAQPAIDAAGTLTFTPNPNKSGSVPVTVTLKDSGGRANGGIDTTAKTFLVNVGPVNDPPSFTLMANPNRNVLQTAGPQTVENFVASFLPGDGPDEASQTVSDYIITVDAPGIFAVLPDISNTGTLTFAPAIDRTGIATVSVQVRDSGGRANGGNDLSGVTTFMISVASGPDVSRPTPVISYVGTALTNQTTFDVEVDFKEPMAAGTFALSDLTVSKGTTANLRDLGGGKFFVAYTAAGDGAVTFGIAANVATDLAGNQNLAATSVARTIDTIGMTPTLGTVISNPSNAASFPVTINFGGTVQGFNLADVTVVGGAASGFTIVNAATGRYSVTVTPAGSGTVTVLVPAGVAMDAAGNDNAASLPLVRTIDRDPPVALLSTSEPARTNKTSFVVTANFGEVVTGLTKSDLVITGGTASDPMLQTNGSYRFTITSPGGPVETRFAAGAVNDLAGNPNAASNTLSLEVDTTALVPVLTSTRSGLTNQVATDIQIAFGKAVDGLTLSDFSITNATLTDLVPVNAAMGQYTARVTATGDGPVNVFLVADVVRDTAGNANAASNVLSWTLDRAAPVATIAANVLPLTNQGTFVLSVDFGKTVTGFQLSDVVASGATLANFQAVSGRLYTMTASATATQVTFDIPAAIASDLAGNANVAATRLAIEVDAAAPTPVLATSAAALSSSATIPVTVNFGEAVTGFDLSDLLLINATTGGFTTVDANAGRYSFTLTPASDGVVSVIVPAGAAIDRAGNLSRVSSLLSRTIDRTPPTVVLSKSVADRTNATTFEVIATFSETVTGLTKTDFVVTGASVSDPVPLGDNRFAVTLSGASGDVTIQIPAAAVTDAAGSANTASSTMQVTVDQSLLSPVLSSTSANVLATDTFPVTVLFGQAVGGFVANKITVVNGAVEGFAIADATSGRYTFNVKATADGDVTVVVAQGVVSNSAGTANEASNVLKRTIDRVAPRPTIGLPFTSVTNLSSFDASIDFAGEVTGFTLADIVPTGATLSNLRLGNDGRYLVTVTANDGPVTLNIPAAAANDLAGNASLAATAATLTVDTTPARPTLSTPTAALSSSSVILVSVEFGEAVTGFTLSDVETQNGTAGNFKVVDAATGKYTVDVTPTGDGVVTAQVIGGAARDLAGNVTLGSTLLSRTIDRTRQTPVLSTSVGAITSQSSFDVNVDFGQAMSGFTIDDVTVSSGTKSAFEDLTGGKFKFRFTSVGDGPVTFGIAANVAADLAGNQNLAATSVTRTIDTVGMKPVLGAVVANPSNATSFPVTINFGEAVQGFTLSDVTVLGGSASQLDTSDAATGAYSFTVTPSGSGTVSVLVPAGVVTDAAGNPNDAADPITRTIDLIAPTPTLATNEPAVTSRTSFVVTANFGEAVTGLNGADLVITGGTASEPVLVRPGVYSFTISATNGAVEMRLAAGAANDLAGNASEASNTLALTIDTSTYNSTLTAAGPAVIRTLAFDAELAFDRPIENLELGDITVVGGTASDLVPIGIGKDRYSFKVTADGDGVVSVVVASGVVVDAAGNANASSNALVRIVDRIAPQVELNSNVPAISNQASFDVMVTFSESVIDLVADSFTIQGATLVTLAPLDPPDASGASSRYALTLADANGDVSVIAQAGAARDVAGNASLGPVTFNRSVDRTAPTVVLSSPVAASSSVATIPVTIQFSEAVLGFDAGDLVIVNANASNFRAVNAAAGTYAVDLAPIADGDVSVLVAANAASDPAGNLSDVSNRLVRTIDRSAPTLTLSSTQPSRTNQTQFEVRIDASEAVSGLSLDSFEVSGARLSNFEALSPTQYVVTVSDAAGPVSIVVAAGAASDGVGNVTANPTSLSLVVDSNKLVPSLSSPSPLVRSTPTFPATVLFGKQVIGFTQSSVTLVNGTLSQFTELDRATGHYSFDVTAVDDGMVTVLVAASVVTDLAGTANDASIQLNVRVDESRPTVTLVPQTSSLTNQAAFLVAINFSEPVLGFDLSDVVVTGGTARDLRPLGGGRFTVEVAAESDRVVIALAEGVVSDEAGNANLPATPITIDVDQTVPTALLSTTAPLVTSLATLPMTVIFGERVSGFTKSDVIVFGGEAGEVTVVDEPTGTYRFDVTPTATTDPAGSLLSVLVPSGAARDAAGNLSQSSQLLVRTVDRTPPVPTLSSNQAARTNQAAFDVLVEFNEPVNPLERDDLVVSGGTASEPTRLSDRRYSYTITADNGPVEISLAAGATTDTAGSASVVSNKLNLEVDTVALGANLTSMAGAVVTSDTFDVSVTFGKTVSALEPSMINVINGEATKVTPLDASRGVFTITIATEQDGLVSVIVPPGVVRDAAGNANLLSNTLSRRVDRVAPTATLEFVAGPSRTTRELDVSFSEPVTGFEIGDLEVSGGSAVSLIRSREGMFFTVSIAPSGDGELAVSLPAGRVQDDAGLGNIASQVVTTDVDISQPVPTLSGTTSSTAGVFNVVIEWSEAVTGLTLNDFQISGGTLSALAGSGARYTATVTASSRADVTLSLPEERVIDGASNSNVASNVLVLSRPVIEAIILEDAGESVVMSELEESLLETVKMIDIRGTGDNSLVIDASVISQFTPNQTLLVLANPGDTVTFGEGWQFVGSEVVNGQRRRTFASGSAKVQIVGPNDWTNPVLPGDVDGNGRVTAGDALLIISGLNLRSVIDDTSLLMDAATVNAGEFQFYDVNGDGRLTAGDALLVINLLNQQPTIPSGEAEQASMAVDVAQPGSDSRTVISTTTASSVIVSSVPDDDALSASQVTEIESQATQVIVAESEDDDDEDSTNEPLDHLLATTLDWMKGV